MNEQKFKVSCSTDFSKLTKKSFTDNADEPLVLEAIISTTSVDLEGDYMTSECIENMKSQVLGLSVFLDHDHTLDKIVGKVIDVFDSSSEFIKVKFEILPRYKSYILEFIEAGVNLGASIGGSVLDYEETENGWAISKMNLHEFSLVGIPANQDTLGTVKISEEVVKAKCFNGACKQIIKKLNSSDLVKELEDGKEEDDECLTRREIVTMINEASNVLKDQIITEIVSEFNLDGKKHQGDYTIDEEEPDNNNGDETDSSTVGDKEKKIMEDNKLEFKVEETKDLENTEANDPKIEEDEVEAPVEDSKTKELTLSNENMEQIAKSIAKIVLKELKEKEEEKIKSSVKEVEEEDEEEKTLEKSFEEEKELLKKELTEEIESKLFKSLSKKEPKPKVKELDLNKNTEKEIKKSNVMSTSKMAELLCNQL